MSKAKKKNTSGTGTIAQNKKARHDYHIEDKFEAGLALIGWEVKSLREGKCQLVDSYILFKNDEAWLLGAHISPLNTVSTHVVADPTRTRKLLLNRREIDRIMGKINQAGLTCVPLSIYWKGNLIKCEIALVRGKKEFDKRATEKERDWNRQKQRVVREHAG
ncbi:MAG: SsrA-binding protein SmpB [Pseudomonadales bacterium]|uniref:SsrA-binding protein n=1 Tax=Oleiphilus messinensis TaxID=141451 RepID=A0A1Y0I503_9GAMM|nr:SsrA-binding protein SmpB [Oleiphilus messinensis]ARU55552.1 trans-translation protein [Oleiphilus messinensis]MCG8611693.1 SsrA-binding protein SmpB [Pseudomonadales bacterium]